VDIQAADRSYKAEALDDLSDLAKRDTLPITGIIDNCSIGAVRQVSQTERYINQR